MHNLLQLLRRLTDAQLNFVVIGGYAGVLHGSSFLTFDLDLCADLSPEMLGKMCAALADLHPVQRVKENQNSILEFATDEGVINVHTKVPGVGDYARLRASAVEIPLFGHNCAVVSIDDLIAAKEAVGREKDLLAAKELRAIAAKRVRS